MTDRTVLAAAASFLWLLTCLALMLALAGCRETERQEADGGPDGEAESLTFALVPKAMNNPFFDQARDGCKEAERELDGIECLYIGPGEHTEQEQIQIVEDLITRRVDGIAVAPSNAPAMARALERAAQARIPVITWDSDLLPEHQSLRATYLGTENRRIGIEQAKVLQKLKPAGGTVCIQSGGAAANNHNERMQGIRDTLSAVNSEAPPGSRLEGQNGWREADGCPLYSNDDFALAVQQLADILTRYSELDAVVVTGGFPQFAGQAYRQLAERYRDRLDSGSTVIVVADTLPMQMEMLEDGLSHAQIGQRPFEMGYRSMQLLQQLRAGQVLEDPIYTGLDVCEQSNVDSCL